MTLGIVGGGAWGTALAITAAANGPVLLWAREAGVVAEINEKRENARFLPGAVIPDGVDATSALADLAACARIAVVAPAQHVRALLAHIPPDKPLLMCAKGIEAGTGALMHEVAGRPVAVLSGPTFAAEVAAGLPTAVTLASADAADGEAWTRRLARPAFRLYWTDDVVGAEVGGAVKNVLAIACGVVGGAGLGDNARAAVIARGFAEMTRFGLALGARAETLAGLSGLGDLVLTCSSPQSRNYALGAALGRGQAPAEALAGGHGVAEGAATAPVLVRLARLQGIDMPIADAVTALLAGAAPGETIARLLARPLRAEVR